MSRIRGVTAALAVMGVLGLVDAAAAAGPTIVEYKRGWRDEGRTVASRARVARVLLALLAFLALGLAAGPGVAAAACPSPWGGNTTCVYVLHGNGYFAGTGSVTVPTGVNSISIEMAGAPGGGGYGGCAGQVSGVLPIPAGGEQMSLVAGGAGGIPKNSGSSQHPGLGGGGGGGAGGGNTYPTQDYTGGNYGSGGGGGSFLFGPHGLIMAAGGGGGMGGAQVSGGNYGGSVAGGANPFCTAIGAGGTTCAGGGQPGTGSGGATGGSGCGGGTAGKGTGPATSTGSVGTGGSGGQGGGDQTCNGSGGGGGGGGYYGGGGGGGGGDDSATSSCEGDGGGGAGSNYGNTQQLSSYTVESDTTDSSEAGWGWVRLSYTSTPPLIVNSTADQSDTSTDLASGICNVNLTGPQACTLRAAIEVANKISGATITFDIPATLNGAANTFDRSNPSVPQIRDPTGAGMPAITAPTTIDGTSQPGAGRVELSGTSGTNFYRGSPTTGLVLSAPAAAVKGLVVNGYSDGIDLKGGREAVQQDWLGTDVAGTAAEPNPLGTNTGLDRLVSQIGVLLESGRNVVGQSVFADHWTINPNQARRAAAIYDTVGANTIQGNWLGVVPNTRNPLVDPDPGAGAVPSWGGLIVAAGADTIGGASAGLGNVVAEGSAVSGDSVLQGNTFLGELHADGNVQIGGPTSTPGTGPGNVFTETRWAGSTRLLEISGGVVQGNRFSDSGAPAVIAEGGVLIGGATPNLGNEITRVATDPAGPEGLPGLDGAITLAFSQNRVENNVISDNGGYAAVQVDFGLGNTITRNVMSGNPDGIVFGHSYASDGQYSPTFNDPGPNHYQPYPVLSSAEAGSSGTDITGLYEEPASFRLMHSITIDLYAMKACNGAPQGLVFLGSRRLSVGLALSQFNLSFGAVPAGHGYDAVTATATAPDGSTSEFSQCFTIGSHPDPWTKLGVAPSTDTVAISTTNPPRGASDAVIARAAAKGHGTLLLLCPVSAVKYCRGTYSLRTTTHHAQTIAHGSFEMIPGYVDPIKLTITGKLLAQLQHKHRIRVLLTTSARDAAKRHNHKTRNITVTLVYKN